MKTAVFQNERPLVKDGNPYVLSNWPNTTLMNGYDERKRRGNHWWYAEDSL